MDIKICTLETGNKGSYYIWNINGVIFKMNINSFFFSFFNFQVAIQRNAYGRNGISKALNHTSKDATANIQASASASSAAASKSCKYF